MTHAVIKRNTETIARTTPGTPTYIERGAFRLSTDEIERIRFRLTNEVKELNALYQILSIIVLTLLIVTLVVVVNTKLIVYAFDGVAVLIAALALPCIYLLLLSLFHRYEEGNNAILSTRIVVESVMLAAQPFLYLLAYKLTEVEIKQNLHNQKWIAVVALSLSLLTGLVALIIGIGVLVAPDLSGLTR